MEKIRREREHTPISRGPKNSGGNSAVWSGSQPNVPGSHGGNGMVFDELVHGSMEVDEIENYTFGA